MMCPVVLATMPPLLSQSPTPAATKGARQVAIDGTTGTTTRIAFDKIKHPPAWYPELAGIWVYERRFTDDELLRLAAAAGVAQ